MRKNNNSGFTLVEILAVVVILGILMVIALPTYSSAYKAIKRSTYINKLRALNVAAVEYGDNAQIKDAIKAQSRVMSGNWCLEYEISDLIKAGYIASDKDDSDVLIDLYTGGQLGYYYKADSNSSSGIATSAVSLCYCYDDLDIKSYLIKELGKGASYHEGEYIRYWEGTGSSIHPVFYYVNSSFSYDSVIRDVKKAIANSDTSIKSQGKTLNLDSSFFGNISDSVLIDKSRALMISTYTEKASCNRHD